MSKKPADNSDFGCLWYFAAAFVELALFVGFYYLLGVVGLRDSARNEVAWYLVMGVFVVTLLVLGVPLWISRRRQQSSQRSRSRRSRNQPETERKRKKRRRKK